MNCCFLRKNTGNFPLSLTGQAKTTIVRKINLIKLRKSSPVKKNSYKLKTSSYSEIARNNKTTRYVVTM